ncbi:MAG: hypothetical protein ACKVJK_15935, partial [Methylophagaceae bacterium]
SHPRHPPPPTSDTLLRFKRFFCYGLNSAPKEYVFYGSFGHYPARDSHSGFLFSTILFMNYLLINQLIKLE